MYTSHTFNLDVDGIGWVKKNPGCIRDKLNLGRVNTMISVRLLTIDIPRMRSFVFIMGMKTPEKTSKTED